MKYYSLITLFILLSCGKKETVLLPKSNTTVVSDVVDHSPIYIFFRTEGKDTIADVNRKNSIISTNWILNIDRRLPLRLVIPEVMKLQQKKREEKAHKNENAENYYAYADSIGKNMAFIAFTDVFYSMQKPLSGSLILHFKKNSDAVVIHNQEIAKDRVVAYIESINYAIQPKIILLFDKNMSFDEYLQTKIIVKDLDTFTEEVPLECIY
ncbi:MAG: hypothetical protein K2Y30_03740 [Flavobacteriaceae bacterium]|uniref:Lipoprotein n=1 Tax=Flavobacterium kayseriense TaxID=2764714 RepID=A0ABR7JB22_9FLAO|nr:hypothetical protein [Flavobacterium kayseriense]MBC5842701.1 hypothetical protein [Flavobacterium kayseriense]MBC5849231.1 hypothetical protein [Flavobacterium kayseriense]MBU0941188.1 hypothetical protein [Bacteroidota bacterium]MBX9887031.1 hypothetical protein [Flavobacteriaceae bacterium]